MLRRIRFQVDPDYGWEKKILEFGFKPIGDFLKADFKYKHRVSKSFLYLIELLNVDTEEVELMLKIRDYSGTLAYQSFSLGDAMGLSQIHGALLDLGFEKTGLTNIIRRVFGNADVKVIFDLDAYSENLEIELVLINTNATDDLLPKIIDKLAIIYDLKAYNHPYAVELRRKSHKYR